MRKYKLSKKILAGILATVMVLSATACSAKEDSEDDAGKDAGKNGNDAVTLTFWNGFTGADGEVLRKIVDDFNANNDKNIKIEMDIMPWDNFNEMLPPAVSSGTAPDFALMMSRDTPQYVKNGALRPMDDFWEFEGVDKSDFNDESINMGILDGTQYSIAMQLQSFYLYWNKDIFKAAGLDPEKPPVTWDELVEIAPKLADPANNVSGFLVPYNIGNVLFSWIVSNGGTVLNEDYTKAEINSTINKEVLTTMQSLVLEQGGPDVISNPEIFNLMNAGQLGMIIAPPFLVSGLQTNEINFGITSVPQVAEDSEKVAIAEAVGFVVPACTDESKIDAIYEFVRHWNTSEVAKRWALEAGFPPYLNSAAKDPEVMENAIITELTGQLDYAELFLPGFENRLALESDIITPMLEGLMQGGEPGTLLQEADDAINNLIGK